jgi:hypothetical protein
MNNPTTSRYNLRLTHPLSTAGDVITIALFLVEAIHEVKVGSNSAQGAICSSWPMNYDGSIL